MKSQLSILPTKKMTLKKLEGGGGQYDPPPQSVRFNTDGVNKIYTCKIRDKFLFLILIKSILLFLSTEKVANKVQKCWTK